MISDEGILYIEPSARTADEPIIDELTQTMAAAFRQATPKSIRYRGIHTCACGANSANYDVVLRNGEETNTLCVHYLAYHRDEVPQEQLERVAALVVDELAIPTDKELKAPSRK
jgi:hypothetical protein